MTGIDAEAFVQACKQRGFRCYTGVPCSYLKPLINYVIDSSDLRYVGATNEGDAVAIAAGSELGGQRSIVMLQNSGLGNAVNPLTSLTYTFELPVLLIVTLRGEPGGPPDEPQHALMGRITSQLLETIECNWAHFPSRSDQIESTLDHALETMNATGRSFALVMRHGSVREMPLKTKPPHRTIAMPKAGEFSTTERPSRQDILRTVQDRVKSNDVVIATTGFTGRELFACDDRENQFYMVGSMGCASSFGLGLALAQPNRRVIVLDGDGALLMRLGALATIGYERPTNLVHIVLDNEVHESTGGQSTVSHSVDFSSIAAACGYPRVVRVSTPDELGELITSGPNQLTLAHVKIKPGVPAGLPRPNVSPPSVARRFRKFIESTSLVEAT